MSDAIPTPDPSAGSGEQQAGAGAGGANAGGGAQARVAGAGAGVDIGMDIGQTEAYTTQLKLLVSHELGHHQRLSTLAEQALGTLVRNADQLAAAHADQVRQLNAAVADNVRNANQDAHTERQRTIRHGDLAADRQWTQSNEAEIAALDRMHRSAETSIRTGDLSAMAAAMGLGIAAALRDLGLTVAKAS